MGRFHQNWLVILQLDVRYVRVEGEASEFGMPMYCHGPAPNNPAPQGFVQVGSCSSKLELLGSAFPLRFALRTVPASAVPGHC